MKTLVQSILDLADQCNYTLTDISEESSERLQKKLDIALHADVIQRPEYLNATVRLSAITKHSPI